ncbi:MAG: hypothetical protein D6732_00790, partial [Methanobacteriota archaeon]
MYLQTQEAVMKFYPNPEFSRNAHIKSLDEYHALYRRSVEDPDGFWGEVAERLDWFKKWDTVREY